MGEVKESRVEIAAVNEPWTEVVLVNGYKIHARLVITEVRHVAGETDAKGNPSFKFDFQVVTSPAQPPETTGADGRRLSLS